MTIHLPDFTNVRTLFEQYFVAGNFDQVLKEGQDLLEQAWLEDEAKKVQFGYLMLIKAYYYVGEMEKAYEHVLLYRQLVEQQNRAHEDFYLYYINAHIYEYEKDFKKVKQAIDQCIAIATINEAYAQLCRVKIFHSQVLLTNGHFEQALAEAESAKELALVHSLTDLHLNFRSELIIACALEKLHNDSARINQLSLHPVAQQNLFERCRLFYTQALNAMHHKDLQTALHHFKEADCIAQKTKAHLMQLRIVTYYVTIYEELGLYKEALEAMKRFTKLKEIFYQTGLSSRIAELNVKYNVAQIQLRANLDPLSGVYNRYYLEERANSWLEQALVDDDHICCIVFDVDNFKAINDTHGHLLGDEVIKMIGKTCLDVLKNTETIVARYGGDEFVVMSKSYGEQDVLDKSQRLFDAITENFVSYEDKIIQVAISMGIVCNRILPTTVFKTLFHAADQALYRAKGQGKNQIVYVQKEASN